MENKYRSLENIIRDIYKESVDNRNTEARKKVVNVGRPDTAPSNLDVKSKLAKQGEIKTKIIDESHKKKYESAPDHVKKVADDIAWIKKQPTDVLKRHADQIQKVHSAKTRDELRSVILSKHGKKNLEAHDKHFFDEEVQIDEAEEKDGSFSDGVADEDKDDKKKKKPESKDKDEKKGEKKADKDDHTPEDKLTFGKTEVELDPKTDDKVDNDSKEKSAGNKARNQVNKEIGQKTSKLKEESTMLKSDDKFGLPQSLIDTVTETLKGGQKKLDKNHNNKLDKEDFKILRGEKVKEEKITETSKPEVSVYDNAAHVKDKTGKVVSSYSKKDHGADYMKKANAHMAKIKEEVKFSEAELAHIETIMNKED